MTYETAKKLKEAGFPVKYTKHGYGRQISVGFPSKYTLAEPVETIEIPTLPELIEACGEGVSLTDFVSQWKASLSKEGFYWYGEGSTPEIAVANLWLALNGKT